MVRGYVDGFNAELAEEGPHGWCEGEPWVQPITTTDVYAYLNDITGFASFGALIQQTGRYELPFFISAGLLLAGALCSLRIDPTKVVEQRT